ncbi:LOW QUALITY PROTEIN: telomerase RNA component interacting RNase [Ornithorhynchus anatinus]|uniref:LOW QUALITY PROTEIN: telomerase RNA component interacting RNase n=1 Tax=Ornithorhynchus anatinus TaxID=9258 RepID=UPI0010A8CE4F|nr:LOW QUALITY PROTEIN: telomerase RNA component interacting RNase [Ornithorhynchus anatinus]
MAARGRRADPAGREPLGPAGGGGGGVRRPVAGPVAAVAAAEDDACGSSSGGVNLFANDGSFLELFKRKMEEEQRRRREEQKEPLPGQGGSTAGPQAAAPGEQKRKIGPVPTLSFVGKRRGGNKLALKTGIVAKKQKTEDEVLTSKGDAWAKYMAEVKKYKAHQCSDDDKTRPLVK